MKKISVREVERLAFKLARDRMTYNEPIPEFSTRYPNVLESCIATPFQTFSKKDLYPGLVGKAAILFYLMNKNHPFKNGNKRIAMTTLLLILFKNKKWIKVNEYKFYQFAIWVASSPSDLEEQTVKAVEAFIEKNMVDIKEK